MPQDRPLIRVGNRMVPGPPVNAHLRALLDARATPQPTITPQGAPVNVSDLQPSVAPPEEPPPNEGLFAMVQEALASLVSQVNDMDPAELFSAAKMGVGAVADYEQDKAGARSPDVLAGASSRSSGGPVRETGGA